MQKILVVDDAEVNREILRVMLEDDYDVIMAADGEEALDALKRRQDDISAVLLDLHAYA